MTAQVSLFDVERKARRRRTDPITSYWAAQGIDVSASEGLVLNAFISGRGTSHELHQRIVASGHSITPQRVRTALSDMEKRGLTIRTGEYGLSENGGPSEIWRRR